MVIFTNISWPRYPSMNLKLLSSPASVSVAGCWLSAFLVTRFTTDIVGAVGDSGAYLAFACVRDRSQMTSAKLLRFLTPPSGHYQIDATHSL